MVGRDEALLNRLDGFLHDKKVAVRLATVHALADLNGPQAMESLRKALDEDEAPEVSFAAAKALADRKDPVGVSALVDFYNGKRKTKSSLIHKEERSVVGEFHSVPSALMFIVGKGVGFAPVPGAGEGLSSMTLLLKDPALSDRAHILLILARTKSSDSLELLRSALQDRDWSVRAVAAQMIAQTARAELRDSLLPLFDDQNRKVRFQAAGAYLHLLLVAKQ
jgi:HEAT repeat protein